MSIFQRYINQQCHWNSRLPQETLWVDPSTEPKVSLPSPGSGTHNCCWLGCNTSKTLSVVNGNAKSTRCTLPSCNSNLASVSWWYVMFNMISSYFLPKTNNNLNTDHYEKWGMDTSSTSRVQALQLHQLQKASGNGCFFSIQFPKCPMSCQSNWAGPTATFRHNLDDYGDFRVNRQWMNIMCKPLGLPIHTIYVGLYLSSMYVYIVSIP